MSEPNDFKRSSFKNSEWTRRVLSKGSARAAALAPASQELSAKEQAAVESPRAHWRGLALSVVVVVLALLVLFVALEGTSAGSSAVYQKEIDQAVARALASATPAPPAAVGVYNQVRPALVEIMAQVPASESSTGLSYGTGFIVDDQGKILTSLHVVRDALAIQITFADGTISEGELLSAQPEKDVAAIRPFNPPSNITPVTIGNPRALQVGDQAIVVGNPMQLAGSLSAGSISGLERLFEPPQGGAPMEHMIQIDAAVNPGNSGGPLLNSNGEVVGIITGRASPGGREAFVGIGFAVPIDQALNSASPLPY